MEQALSHVIHLRFAFRQPWGDYRMYPGDYRMYPCGGVSVATKTVEDEFHVKITDITASFCSPDDTFSVGKINELSTPIGVTHHFTYPQSSIPLAVATILSRNHRAKSWIYYTLEHLRKFSADGVHLLPLDPCGWPALKPVVSFIDGQICVKPSLLRKAMELDCWFAE